MLQPAGPLDCRDVEAWLHVVLDKEASPEDRAVLEGHLARCHACAARADLFERTTAALRAAAARTDLAPASLEARVRRSLSRAGGRRPLARGRLLRAALLVAFSAALGVALAAVRFGEVPAPSPVIARSVEQHGLDVPVDIASPDPGQVARFLAPRVGVEVRVPRLDAAGWALFGGRVISLDDRRAAQLVYTGGLGRRLSVVAVPDPDGRLSTGLAHEAAGLAKEALTASLEPALLFRGHKGSLFVEVLRHEGALYSLVGDDPRVDLLGSLRARR